MLLPKKKNRRSLMRELKGSSLEERDRISQFIQAFQRDNASFLESIREDTQKEAVPIIRDETAALLRVCLEMKKPKSILELGTAGGGFCFLSMLVAASIDRTKEFSCPA